jgi:hypothetical protein
MAGTLNSQRSHLTGIEGAAYANVSAKDAFLGVFGSPITLNREAKNLVDNGGFNVYAIASETQALITVGLKTITNHYLFVHEIFHILDMVILGGAANQSLWDVQRAPGSTFPNRPKLFLIV